MFVADRSQLVERNNLCRCCLNPGHIAKNCNRKIKCRRRNCKNQESHNTLLHLASFSPPGNRKENDTSTPFSSTPSAFTKSVNDKSLAMSTQISSLTCSKAYLDIVPVRVKVKDDAVFTYALLDSGSGKTFCEREIVNELGLNNCPINLAVQTLSPGNLLVLGTIAVFLSISSLDNSYSLDLSKVVVIDSLPVAPSAIANSASIQKHSHLEGVSLTEIEGGSVTLLIGNDYAAAYWCYESRFSPNLVGCCMELT